MSKLQKISTERRRTALDDPAEAKAVKRLMVALQHKDMVVTTIAERYGIPHSTICSWLDRLENQPIADALLGELRPGLPPKLTPSHRVDTWLDGTPRAVGHGEAELAAERLHVRIQDVFDIEYSEAHIHRLFVT